jgi:hypothetical protein
MPSNDQQAADETPTIADRLILWLFIFGAVVVVGLGIWALFFKA